MSAICRLFQDTADCPLSQETEYVDELGGGAFGTVYKARNRTTGRLFAVKIVDDMGGIGQEAAHRGEGVILPKLDHEHIIRSFHSHGWDTRRAEIFMDLMDGDLHSLAYSVPKRQLEPLARRVLHQMLQALDYLSSLGLVHRDLKPANIFYTTTAAAATSQNPEEQYHFRLGDFGLCENKSKLNTRSFAPGTHLFMAPELLVRPRRHKQSHKSDVWALYVTLLWTKAVPGVRLQELLGRHSTTSAMEFAEDLVAYDWGESVKNDPLRGMGKKNPGSRWTAGRVLDEMFEGVGRVTSD